MEAAQDAQAVLAPAPVVLQLVRLRPGRLALRWLLPLLLALVAGGIMLLGRALGSPAVRGGGTVLGIAGGALLLWHLQRRYPEAGLQVIGTLTLQAASLEWQLTGEAPRHLPLHPGGPLITIRYTGYEGETVGRTTLPGYENFIAIGSGPLRRFWAPDADVPAGLQAILRGWYHRRVAVKEYCQDSRTFLLARDLSYEQIQAYKREFGVSLYG